MMMNDFFPLAAAILTAGFGTGYLARLGLDTVAPEAELSAAKRYGFALLGAAMVSIAVLAGPMPGSFPIMIGMCAFGALAGVLAIMDRDTAWAPDALTIPLTLLAFTMGSLNYGTMPFFLSILAAVLVFAAAQGCWWLQDRFDLRVLPPPDFLAFVIPAALLGLSFSLAVFYIAVASMILILRQNPDLMPVFFHKQALDEAAGDLGFGERPAVTFLAIAFPALAVIVFCDAFLSL